MVFRSVGSCKEQTAPIIILTARGGEVDRIVGLESGADGDIVKPFSLGEFLVRVRAALRRVPQAMLRADRIELDGLLAVGGAQPGAHRRPCDECPSAWYS